jgi:hypothetical protein
VITSLDLWHFVEELLPVIKEVERIEAMAAQGENSNDLPNISKPKQ